MQSPEEIQKFVEISLKNLRRKLLDILYLHRIDPSASAETYAQTIAAMKNLVLTGKVKHVDLSERTQDQLLAAIDVEPKSIPISAVQCAYSLFTRRVEERGVLKTGQENKILLVSYTSVLRGLADVRLNQITEGDVTNLLISELKDKVFGLLNIDHMPQSVGWFADEYIRENVRIAHKLINEAERLNVTPEQLVLAWSIGRGDHFR